MAFSMDKKATKEIFMGKAPFIGMKEISIMVPILIILLLRNVGGK
jgi:hypothetical protein